MADAEPKDVVTKVVDAEGLERESAAGSSPMNGDYAGNLRRFVKGNLPVAAEVDVYDEDGDYCERVVVKVQPLAGGRPVYIARMHPDVSGLSANTLGHRIVEDFEEFGAFQDALEATFNSLPK